MVGVRKAADTPTKARYHHGDLRNALVEAAVDLVAARGVQGFSLREAAREVGVSPAAAYRHFDDRSALLTAVAVDGMGRLATLMEQAMAAVPGRRGTAPHATAAFGAMGAAYVEFAVRHPSHFRVMFGAWCQNPKAEALPPGMAPMGRDPFQILVDALDDLVSAGAVPAASRAGAEVVAWASVHGLSSLLVDASLELGPAERGAATTLLCRTVLGGLGCAPSLLAAVAPAPEIDPRPPAARRPRRRSPG